MFTKSRRWTIVVHLNPVQIQLNIYMVYSAPTSALRALRLEFISALRASPHVLVSFWKLTINFDLTINPILISQLIQLGAQFCLNLFIYLFMSLLYMFRASMCPSSGENFCIYATLTLVTLKGGSFKLQKLLHKIQGVAY